MRLSNRTEYALLALVFLSRMKGEQFAHGEDIADTQGIPIKFLQQILFSLKRARIIKSVKGPSGGYALARKPSEISIAEILRLFDGPLAASYSASEHFYEETPIAKERKVVGLFKELRDVVSDKLENTFLSDLS